MSEWRDGGGTGGGRTCENAVVHRPSGRPSTSGCCGAPTNIGHSMGTRGLAVAASNASGGIAYLQEGSFAASVLCWCWFSRIASRRGRGRRQPRWRQRRRQRRGQRQRRRRNRSKLGGRRFRRNRGGICSGFRQHAIAARLAGLLRPGHMTRGSPRCPPPPSSSCPCFIARPEPPRCRPGSCIVSLALSHSTVTDLAWRVARSACDNYV